MREIYFFELRPHETFYEIPVRRNGYRGPMLRKLNDSQFTVFPSSRNNRLNTRSHHQNYDGDPDMLVATDDKTYKTKVKLGATSFRRLRAGTVFLFDAPENDRPSWGDVRPHLGQFATVSQLKHPTAIIFEGEQPRYVAVPPLTKVLAVIAPPRRTQCAFCGGCGWFLRPPANGDDYQIGICLPCNKFSTITNAEDTAIECGVPLVLSPDPNAGHRVIGPHWRPLVPREMTLTVKVTVQTMLPDLEAVTFIQERLLGSINGLACVDRSSISGGYHLPAPASPVPTAPRERSIVLPEN